MPTTTIYAYTDTYLNGKATDTNYGAGDIIKIGVYKLGGVKNELDRPLFNFDVSALSGYDIQEATLVRDYANVTNGGYPATAYRCTRPADWTELGATWNKYDGSNAWTLGGGDVDTSTPTPIHYAEATDYGERLEIAGFAPFVADAIANRAGIVSLRLQNDAEQPADQHWAEFWSHEAFGGVNGPRLVIDYTLPAPPSPERRSAIGGHMGEQRARQPVAPAAGRRPSPEGQPTNPRGGRRP